VIQSLLRAQLGHRVNVMILEKALTLDLAHFEDAEFYDKLTRARREASSRPLSLVGRTFSLVQNGISLVSFAALLAAFSPWAALILALAGLPSFIAEAKFSGDAFRLFRWRSPETRMQMYLEGAITRDDYAKEVKLYQLGPLFLGRYRKIFTTSTARTASSPCAAACGATASASSAPPPSTAPTHGSPPPPSPARSPSAR
jgi:ATP-binding cassette subfamily B protein